MPHLAHLQVWDNSADVVPGKAVADPVLVLEMEEGRLTWPARDDLQQLSHTPGWARAIVAAAVQLAR